MAVGGAGRPLPAGGGEDGRFLEGAPGVQQEQLQQVPCGFRLQGFQPPALGVPAHQRIPLGADNRDREDEHPSALPPPAVGQKECGQEAGAGAGGAGGGELGPAAENRPDRQPGHDRGHLKSRESGNSQGSSRFFAPPPPSGNSRDPPYLFGICLLAAFWFVFMGFLWRGRICSSLGALSAGIPVFPGIPGCCSPFPKFPFFPAIPGICS